MIKEPDILSEACPVLDGDRDLTAAEISEYQTRGVVLVRNSISPEWVQHMSKVIDAKLAAPTQFGMSINKSGGAGSFLTDRYLWPTVPSFRDYAFRSGVGRQAGQAMQSTTASLYFDQVFVKEPLTNEAFNWHQDRPYWPVGGDQICSVWTSFSTVDAETSALEFVIGTDRLARDYKPTMSESSGIFASDDQDDMPDFSLEREQREIISFQVNPGDSIIFNARIVHSSRGNSSPTVRRVALSTRWLGDDAIWRPRPGADPAVTQDMVAVAPGERTAGDRERFPLVWHR